jgi:hypothetical protein
MEKRSRALTGDTPDLLRQKERRSQSRTTVLVGSWPNKSIFRSSTYGKVSGRCEADSLDAPCTPSTRYGVVGLEIDHPLHQNP